MVIPVRRTKLLFSGMTNQTEPLQNMAESERSGLGVFVDPLYELLGDLLSLNKRVLVVDGF